METKFKIGDTVLIKSKEWYNENKTVAGNINIFIEAMSKYCGRIAVVIEAVPYGHRLDIDGGQYRWPEFCMDVVKIIPAEEPTPPVQLDNTTAKTIDRMISFMSDSNELNNLYLWVMGLKSGENLRLACNNDKVTYIANYIMELKNGK